MVALLFAALPINTCFAETVDGPVVDIKIFRIENNPDGITVALDFKQNPGIGALAFSIKYDNTVFETKAIRKSKFYSCALKNYLIVDHPETGTVSLVWVDHTDGNDYFGTGTLFELDFNIKNHVKGEYTFSALGDLSGAFANFAKDTLSPTVNPATIFVWEEGSCIDYSDHNFSEWETSNPSCEIDGKSQRYCKNCGITESKVIPAIGHAFSSEWTVDRQSEKGVLGIKSRHCKNCGAITDKKYFSVENNNEVIVENNSEEKDSGEVLISDIIDDDTSGENTVSDANEIIKQFEKALKSKISKPKTMGDWFAAIHDYLYGTNSQKGLFEIIKEIIKEALSK